MRRKRLFLGIGLIVLLVGIMMFLLSFHIVVRRNLPIIVAKDSMTLKSTFITVKGYLRRYSEASPEEQIELEKSRLHRTLVRKGLIKRTKETISPPNWRF